jgi:hypothetical protein
MCSYWKQNVEGINKFLYVSNSSAYQVLSFVNLFMFFFVNWFFLLAMITMMFRIRHIKDNLSLITEL